MSAKPMTRTAALRRDLKLEIARAEKAEAALAAMTASRDRLVAYVMADDALFLAAVSNSPERFAMDKARRAARAAVDAAADLKETP